MSWYRFPTIRVLLVLVGLLLSAPALATTLQPVPLGQPRIDLRSVEQALWSTKAGHPKDFKGWMQAFEDEVNAIYFATLRRLQPKADPATLLSQPVRVDAQRIHGLLYLYGYIDQNNRQGFQNGQDMLLFVFEQTKTYNHQSRQLYYGLRDGDGYYYRQPDTIYTIGPTDFLFLTGFFVYPNVWGGLYWRNGFAWWGTPYWQTGLFFNRVQLYYGWYPRYHQFYRRTYYTRYRPWGWRRGTFYRRGANGRYYSRPGYIRTFRGGWRRGYYRGYRRGFRRGLRRQRNRQIRRNRRNRQIRQPRRSGRSGRSVGRRRR